MLQIKPHNTENVEKFISKLENDLNIVLPEDYKQFLTKYNGGWTPRTIIFFDDLEHGIAGFIGVGDAEEGSNFKYYINNEVDVIRNEFFEDIKNGYLKIASWYGAYYYIDIKPESDCYGSIYYMDEDREKYIYVCANFKELTQKASTPDFHVNTPEENIQYYKERGWEEELTRSLIKQWQKVYNERKDVKLVPVIID